MASRKLTPKLKQQIAELVACGLDVKQALTQLGNPVSAQCVYKEGAKDLDLKETMSSAYFSHFMAKTSELNELSSAPASELYPALDFREAEACLKRRVDALKFQLSKLAPILTKQWEHVQKVEHSGVVGGITVVMDSYYKQVIDHEPVCIDSPK